jgi:hypothetical protein
MEAIPTPAYTTCACTVTLSSFGGGRAAAADHYEHDLITLSTFRGDGALQSVCADGDELD